MKVNFSNNYSIRRSQSLYEQGRYPAQHLYGAAALVEAGMDVSLIDARSEDTMTRLSARLGWRFGSLSQISRALRSGSTDVVDVAGEPYHVAALARLRARGLRRQALVAVVHQRLPRTKLSQELAHGIDVAVCLSRIVQAQLVEEFGRRLERTPWLPWGPDLNFIGYQSAGDCFVLSSGKTGRDVQVLAEALHGTNVPARIYGLRNSMRTVVGIGSRKPLDFEFEQVLPDMQRAAIFAIPLENADRLVGLTELADALALGKPIVMTRNSFVDVDLERVGCGIWVDRGDHAGWRTALTELWADPERRSAMGAAGRRFAEHHWNASLFGEGIVEAVRLATGPR